jgi:hypothetical protein
MKKLVMLIPLGLVVPMFGARPVLKYGDINPITGKVVERYKQKATEKLPPKPVRVNKGKLVKIAEEEELFTPEERKLFMQEEEQEMLPERRPAYVGFVDQEGQPLPPALPPRPTTGHATKELNAQDLQNLKLGQSTRPSKQFTAEDLKNVKLRSASTAGTKEALMVEKQTGQKEMVKRPFSATDLIAKKGSLKPSTKKPSGVDLMMRRARKDRGLSEETGLRESLNAEITKRRGSISGSEQEEVAEEWED